MLRIDFEIRKFDMSYIETFFNSPTKESVWPFMLMNIITRYNFKDSCLG